ncbi:MAG: bifunctional precorrin-2 dehydrogenase/sirohydrochlorin ferrochelatase [Thermodesulfobacteriota bacterium]
MPYYPALLDLSGRLVLLVGGGQVAARKIASLIEAGARVRLVAPELAPETLAAAGKPGVELRQRGFEAADMEGAALVISATDDQALNRAVAAEAGKRGLFVNVVDVPELCSFIVPAVLRRGDLVVAMSTSGASPAAAARLRRDLEQRLGPEWALYLRILKAVRARLTALGRPAAENRPLFYRLVDSELRATVAAGDAAGAGAVLRRVLGPGCGLAELGIAPGEFQAGEGSKLR